MAKAICIHGHFYDDEKFQTCPHCAAGMKPATPSAFAVAREASQEESGKAKTEKKRKLFGRRKENKGKRGEDTTEDRAQALAANGPNAAQSNGVSQVTGQESGYRPEPVQSSQIAAAYDETNTQKLDNAYLKEMGGKSKEMPSKEMERDYSERIPERSMENTVGNGEGGTAGNGQRVSGQNEGRTIGYFSTGVDKEPPVGYLICIEGEDYGTGFPLKSGNNSLGRSGSMDIVVMDPKVSREKQAYVMYEPHKREFFLKTGDSAGLCYLNDELVLEPKKLQAYDLIQLGDTKLMLIPVCGEKFSW